MTETFAHYRRERNRHIYEIQNNEALLEIPVRWKLQLKLDNVKSSTTREM